MPTINSPITDLDASQVVQRVFQVDDDSIRVSGNITASNQSVAPNGGPIPADSNLVAGTNPEGNLTPISVDDSGNQNVNVVHSVLPTGASTAANQSTEIASLASIDSKTPALGQALDAGSVPVVLPADQISTLTPLTSVTVTQATGTNLHTVVDASALPTGASTAANQSTANTSLATIATNTTNAGTPVVSGTVTVTQATGSNLHTVVDSSALPSGASTAANQSTANTSLATIATNTSNAGTPVVSGTVTVTQATGTSLHTVVDASALPTGGATAANQATLITNTDVSTNGAATSALQTTGNASLATIATNTASASTSDTYITGAAPATQVISSNLLNTTANNAAAIDTNGFHSISLEVVQTNPTTTFAYFEGSNDNVNFVNFSLFNSATLIAAPVGNLTFSPSTTAYFEGPLLFRYIRFRNNAAITTAGVQCFTRLMVVPYTALRNSLAQGSQAIGTVSIGGGTLPTVSAVTAITNALPAGTNKIGLVGTGGSVGVANAPVYNNYATTPVTTSAYVTLVASTTAILNFIDIFDSSGQAMILATGTAGSEVILAYVPPGGDQISVTIAASTRLSVKALTASATSGYILLNVWK